MGITYSSKQLPAMKVRSIFTSWEENHWAWFHIHMAACIHIPCNTLLIPQEHCITTLTNQATLLLIDAFVTYLLGMGHSFVNNFKWMLRVNEANEGFNKMKWSISPSEQKAERINESLKWKQEKNENSKMKTPECIREWWLMKDELWIYI